MSVVQFHDSPKGGALFWPDVAWTDGLSIIDVNTIMRAQLCGGAGVAVFVLSSLVKCAPCRLIREVDAGEALGHDPHFSSLAGRGVQAFNHDSITLPTKSLMEVDLGAGKCILSCNMPENMMLLGNKGERLRYQDIHDFIKGGTFGISRYTRLYLNIK